MSVCTHLAGRSRLCVEYDFKKIRGLLFSSPLILRDFNALTEDFRKRKTTKDVPLYDPEYGHGSFKPVKAAYIQTDIDRNTLKPKYKLKWRS